MQAPRRLSSFCSQKVVSLNKIAMKSADTKGEHDEKIHRKVGGLAP
jgi:hypothetical protein